MSDGGDVDMAAVGELLADRARCRILLALLDGRALPASTLAAEAGVAASTASAHLGRLTEGGLLAVIPQGRFRYYRLAGREVGRLVEVLGSLAPTRPVTSLREGTRAHAVRLARRCYDHLAGRLGVAVADALRERGYVEGPDGTPDLSAVTGPRVSGGVVDEADYRLTEPGRDALRTLGARIPDDVGAVRCCIDWTEQRHHLAGPLGAAVLAAFDDAGWVAPARARGAHRAVTLTDAGVAGLGEHLGVAWPPPVAERAIA